MPGPTGSASTPADGPAPHSLLMSMRDIAELAGVRRPVVTTWRRRHPDFPRPVAGDASQPLFDPHAVAGWLVGTGRAERDQIEPDLILFTLASLGSGMRPKDLVGLVTALICLRYLDDDEPLADGVSDIIASLRDRAAARDPGDELLLAEIRSMPRDAGWMTAAVDDLVEAAWGCRGAFERIMAARHRIKAGDLFTSAVRPELGRLIARISGAAERASRDGSIVVGDLSAGPGDLLTAVVDLLGDDYTPMCIAAERDPYLARIARRRLLVHGLPLVDIDVQIASALPDDSGEPDVIVTQIPYTPGEDRSAMDVLDVIDDVSLRLRPGCSAVVLGPADVLVDELPPYSEAERTRARLLKDGMVEAVVRLPGGLVPFRPGYETALWVLTSARDSPWRGRLLVADVSNQELNGDAAEALTEEVITWRRDGYNPDVHARTFGVQVNIGDLVEPPRPLTARRPRNIRTVVTEAADRLSRALSLETELDRIGAGATAVRGHIRSGLVADVHVRPALASIGKLSGDRLIAVLKGTRIDPADISGDGNHAVLGPDEAVGARRPGERMLDRAVLAQRYPRAKLTEPGDLLVTTVPRFAVLVDHDGFSVAEFPARVLRIRDAGRSRFTPRVLAALLGTDRSSARPGGAVRDARRLEDHTVALLDPAEVTRLDTLLAEIDARRNHARQEIDMLDELASIAATGLADGTLTLADSPT